MFSVINLLGLVLGIVFAFLAFLFAQNKFAYDKQFTNTDKTYLLICSNGHNQIMYYGQPAVFTEEILKDVPKFSSRMRLQWSDENLKEKDTRLETVDFIYSDSSFFGFWGWNLIFGSVPVR